MNRKWFYLIAALLVFLPIFLNAARGEEIPSPRIPSGKVLNEHVKSRVRTKYARICEAILVESKKHGFDPLIVAAIIETESRFRTRLRGRYGEIG
jgi:soluble lytic murein transglycosylase-like protein